MNSFTFYTPTDVRFGVHTVQQVATLVQQYHGTKVLLHYGGGSVVRSGLLQTVEELLRSAGIKYVTLGGVVPNPQLHTVYAGIALGKREAVDFILALGGGSVIDSAKAIAYGLANKGDVWDFFAHTRRAQAALPVGVILTIAAAGSETSNSCVITNEETGEKRAYDDDISRPAFAIMDPSLTLTLPDYQTACGAVDILMHTEERYFTNGDTLEITDSMAEALMRTVIANAYKLKVNRYDLKARAEIMWAGSLSHNGLTGCGNDGGDFASHMLEHELSGMFHVAHGAGLAALWPSWARYVYTSCLPKFKRFATQVLGVPATGTDEEIALAGIAKMENFYHDLGMPTNLQELGITPTDADIAEMARRCAVATGGTIGSARPLGYEDMVAIYQQARG